MQSTKKDSNRIAKVNSLVERALGPILREILQGQNGLVTVVKADTSKDMKWCKVWISILGGDDLKILDFLNQNIYEIQGGLNRQFATKIIPKISFHLDTSPRHAQHIDELIRKLHEEK